MSEFAVIGMGRFGRAVARNLVREGQSVLAIDRDLRRLELVSGEVDATARADTTDEEAMTALKLDRMACVVVTIGSRATEASVLTVAILRELGVPRIVARSFNERHGRVLLSIGANEVLDPEDEIGGRLALRLVRPSILDQLRFGEIRLAEVEVPEAFVGQSLEELELRSRFDVNVLAIQRDDAVTPNPGPEAMIASGDVLVVLGSEVAITRMAGLK
jgi:trk system potassium uptake protein TrkA